MPVRRKSFVKKFFVPVPVSMLRLTLRLPPMHPRSPQRERLAESRLKITLLRRRKSLEGIGSFAL